MTWAFIGALLILIGGSGGGGHNSIAEIIAMPFVFAVSAAFVMFWVFGPFYVSLWFPNANLWYVAPPWYVGTLALNWYFAGRRLQR